jgi:rubrerythrin
MSDTLIGASVWEQDLYRHLTSHIDNERGLLEAYDRAANESASTAFSYLVKLIIDDEIRHHRSFSALAESLRTDAELRPEDPAVPRMDWHRADAGQIAALTATLFDQEREDLKELKRLENELHDVKDTTLWVLLVQLMEADTEKHMAILKFVKDHI